MADRQTQLIARGPHAFAGYAILGALLAVGATAGLCWVAGFDVVIGRLGGIRWPWVVAAAAGQTVAYVGYMLAYREMSRVDSGPEFRRGDLAALVSTGFGIFIPRGGFSVDLEALRVAGVPRREARTRVLGLGVLEYAILAPVACAASIYLIVRYGGKPSYSLTLPWAIGVPAGFALMAVAFLHHGWFHEGGRCRGALAHGLDAVEVVGRVAARPLKHGPGLLGMVLYWIGDIFCLWAALHAFTAASPRLSILVLGYATGYALTRRTLPLAGAGVVEVLLPLALVLVGIALAPAILAVSAYRVLNLWLPLLPATVGLRALRVGSFHGRRVIRRPGRTRARTPAGPPGAEP